MRYILLLLLLSFAHADDVTDALMLVARKRFRQRRYSNTYTLTKKVLKIDENNAEAHFLLAKSLEKMGRKTGAIKHYRTVINSPFAVDPAMTKTCRSKLETLDAYNKKLLNIERSIHPKLLFLYRRATRKNRDDIAEKIENVLRAFGQESPLYYYCNFSHQSAKTRWHWTGSSDELKWARNGVELNNSGGNDESKRLICNRKFSGNLKFEVKFKIRNREFRIYLGDYWFILDGRRDRFHCLRTERSPRKKYILIKDRKKFVIPGKWHTFTAMVLGNQCSVFLDRHKLAVLTGKPLMNATLELYTIPSRHVTISKVRVRR